LNQWGWIHSDSADLPDCHFLRIQMRKKPLHRIGILGLGHRRQAADEDFT
jgi:hypothetical protein